MLPRKELFRLSAALVDTHDLIEEVLVPKHLVHEQPHVRTQPPVKVDIDESVVRHQVSDQDEPFVHHRQKRVTAGTPGVPVCQLFENRRRLGDFIVSDLNVYREICTHIEWRIDVDEFESTRVLDPLTHGAVRQGRKDQPVVSPDEFVRPSAGLPPRRRSFEQRQFSDGLISGLVDLFYG